MKLDYGWNNPSDFRRWGPYLAFGNHASSEMIISWQSKFFSMKHWIAYGETDECKNLIEEDINPTTMHTFTLSNLKPDTMYYFKISRSEDIQLDTPPIYSFRTGPLEGTPTNYDFCILGDLHASQENLIEEYQAIKRNIPDCQFIVTVGDSVTHGGVEERWNEFFYQLSFLPYNIPFMNATGNHDTDHAETYAHYIQTFHYPYHDINIGGYYYFIYGNSLFIVLDSTNAGQTAATQGVISDEQMEWLESILDEYAKKDYWVFIFTHHQVYSTGDSGMMYLYELAYRGLFDDYHVDAVFFGHDHHFEVYWTGREYDWGGTHYILVGNGGKDIGLFNMDRLRKPSLPNYLWKSRTYVYERDGILGGNIKEGVRNDDAVKKYQVFGIMEQGFTHMTIDGDDCTLRMIGVQNQIYFENKIKRAGKGKKYHKPEFHI